MNGRNESTHFFRKPNKKNDLGIIVRRIFLATQHSQFRLKRELKRSEKNDY